MTERDDHLYEYIENDKDERAALQREEMMCSCDEDPVAFRIRFAYATHHVDVTLTTGRVRQLIGTNGLYGTTWDENTTGSARMKYAEWYELANMLIYGSEQHATVVEFVDVSGAMIDRRPGVIAPHQMRKRIDDEQSGRFDECQGS